jgi:hypothetical protein
VSNDECRMTNDGVPAAKTSGVSVQRLVIVAVMLVGGAGTFLPWLTIPELGTLDGRGGEGQVGDGWITLTLFAMVGALTVFGKWTSDLRGGMRVLCVILLLLAAATGIYDVIMIRTNLIGPDAPNDAAMQEFHDSMVIGPGLYTVIFAGLCGIVMLFAMASKRRR